jgi:hypothetical protein
LAKKFHPFLQLSILLMEAIEEVSHKVIDDLVSRADKAIDLGFTSLANSRDACHDS